MEDPYCNNCKRNISAANFATHSAFCERNIKICQLCNEPVPISEKEKHLEEQHITSSCELCGIILEKWMLDKHKDSCTKRLIICEYCDGEFPFDRFSEHFEFCSTKTEKCVLCRKYIMLKDMETHAEFHILERKNHLKNIANEVGSNSGSSEESMQDKESSIKRPVTCELCDKEIPFYKFPEHFELCSCKTEKCSLCQKYIMLKDKKAHYELHGWDGKNHHENIVNEESCTIRQVTCEFCNEEVSSKEFPAHFEFCSSKTEKCLICQKYVMVKDKKAHTESHKCEKKFSHSTIEKEVAQNMINEVISNSCSSAQSSMQEKVFANQSSNSQIIVSSRAETRGVASALFSDSAKEKDKHYTTCYICNQSIKWIDFNTHVPTCATDAGKCSRCGEAVPKHEIKDHMLKTCKLLAGKEISHNTRDLKSNEVDRNKADRNVAEEDLGANYMEKCVYCDQPCSVDRIVEHQKNCAENLYVCPLCCEKVPESNKCRHESFECKTLLDMNEETLYPDAVYDTSRQWNRKYKSQSSPEGSLSIKERLVLRNSDKSYADATKESSKEKNKNSSKCNTCCPCNKNSQLKSQEHSYGCKNQKSNCLYCDEEIDVTKEDIHLNTCKKFIASDISGPAYQRNYKGAVPKHSSFANMVKPQMAKCKFCKVVLNADILHFHEKECVHQLMPCKQCDAQVALKDVDKHKCKSKRGGRGRQVKTEEKNEHSFGSKFCSWFGRNDGYNYNTRAHSRYHEDTSYHNRINNQNSTWFSESATEDIEIPCEFCNKLFPASQIVLHETGCEPELVSYGNKNLEVKENKSSTPPNTIVQQHSHMSEEKFFPTERKVLSSTRTEKIKKYITSDIEPGEFLKNMYDIKTSAKDLQSNQNESVNNSNKTTITSFWNGSSSDIEEETTHLKVLSQVPDNEKEIETLQPNITHKQVKDELFHSDEEVSDLLEFINEKERSAPDEKMKKNALYLASDYGSHSLKHYEENKKFLDIAESTSGLHSEEAMEIVHEKNNGSFAIKDLKHLPDVLSKKSTYYKKNEFTIEPVEELWQRKQKDERNVNHYVENNQDLLEQYKENHYETPEDVEKWKKWQNRKSSDSS